MKKLIVTLVKIGSFIIYTTYASSKVQNYVEINRLGH